MTNKLREAAQQVLYAMAMLIDPEKQEPWQIELYDKTTNALRAALEEQPAEQESMAVACQISALGDSWADFPLERAQEAIEHGLNVRYLGVLRQKPVKPAEQSASHGEPVVVPPIDYDALIAAAYATNKKWAQGTNGCIAFKHGAEWFRQTLTTPEAPQPAIPPGYKLVPVEPTEAMKDVQTWDYGMFRPASEIWADMLAAAPEAPQPKAEPVAWTPRELELIDGMIEVQLHHADQCDRIANRTMAEKQKGWDMERVALLRKIRDTAPQPAKREPLTVQQITEIERYGEFWETGTPLEFARAIERAHGIGGEV